jgi:hypothetical protein
MTTCPHVNFPRGKIAGEFFDNGRKIVLLRPCQFVDHEYGIDLTAPEFFVSDGNSVGRSAGWFFSIWDYPAAPVFHDLVFRHPPEGWSRENADWLHWRLLRLLGCPKWKAEMVFQTLSARSKGAWNRYRALEQPRG